MTSRSTRFPLLLMPWLLALTACSAARPQLKAAMAPLPLRPAPLERDHFRGDESPVIGDEALHEVLDAPVFLEKRARVGVLPVATRYAVDRAAPLDAPVEALTQALTASGHFELATHVSADWPAGSGVAGLRELAARYRCEYLLLYRHRFVDRSWTNGWGATWLTLVGGLVAPVHTLETAGLLEATLFDVKTGTLLFTAYERIHERVDANVWQNTRKRRDLKSRLLERAADGLSERIRAQTTRLAAARSAEPALSQRRANTMRRLPVSTSSAERVKSASSGAVAEGTVQRRPAPLR